MYNTFEQLISECDMRPYQRALAKQLHSYQNAFGECTYPTISDLARDTGIEEDVVQVVLYELMELGWVIDVGYKQYEVSWPKHLVEALESDECI